MGLNYGHANGQQDNLCAAPKKLYAILLSHSFFFVQHTNGHVFLRKTVAHTSWNVHMSSFSNVEHHFEASIIQHQ